MVWQVEGLQHTHKMVTQDLGIDKSTIGRIIALFQTTGSISSKPYPKEKAL